MRLFLTMFAILDHHIPRHNQRSPSAFFGCLMRLVDVRCMPILLLTVFACSQPILASEDSSRQPMGVRSIDPRTDADEPTDGETNALKIVRLHVGEIWETTIEPGRRVLVGTPQVISYQIRNESLSVTGRGVGRSSLTIGSRRYRFVVFEEGEQSDQLGLLQIILKDVEGAKVSSTGEQVVIYGTLLNQHALDQVRDIAERMDVVCVAHVDESHHFPTPTIQLTFRFAEANREGIQKLGIDWSKGIVTTLLTAAGLALTSNVLQGKEPELLKELTPGLISAATSVPLPMEQSDSEGTVSTVASTDALNAPSDEILVALESGNLVKLHEVHDLLVANGDSSDYFYGGTLLIPVSGGQNGDVERVDYGVKVVARPWLDQSGSIRLDFQYEASAISPDAPSGTYNIQKRSGHTILLLREGDSIAIAGVMRDESGKGRTGLPFLSRIPLLGRLFGVKASQERLTDGVLLVGARVLRPEAASRPQRLERVLDQTLEGGRPPTLQQP